MKRIGFTMVELLVVIAIILILAAIIFPAALNAKDAAYRSSDMSHLNELRSALQLYRVDQGAYPPELFGYVEPYGATPGHATPPEQIQAYLFPKRVTSISTFEPAYDHATDTAIVGGQTDASTGCPAAAGATPCVYWPGLPVTSPAPASLGCSVTALGNDVPVRVDPTNKHSPVIELYGVDGYDVAPVKESDGSTKYEIHYALFWSGFGLGPAYNDDPAIHAVSGCAFGSSGDDPRQLGYNNPPDNTVVTWDTFFRDYVNNAPTVQKRDVVLFVGGNAKMYDSHAVSGANWTTSP